MYSWHHNHSVWKSYKMSHMIFLVLTFFNNFCRIKSDLSGNTVWTQASGYQKPAKLTTFGIFNELLCSHNVNVTRFARNVERDFLCDFQKLCIILTWIHTDREEIYTKQMLWSQKKLHSLKPHSSTLALNMGLLYNPKLLLSSLFLFFKDIFWKEPFHYINWYLKLHFRCRQILDTLKKTRLKSVLAEDREIVTISWFQFSKSIQKNTKLYISISNTFTISRVTTLLQIY